MIALRNPELKGLVKYLSSKYGLTQAHIEEILEAPFELTAHVMKTETDRKKIFFPVIRIPFFGLFYCSDEIRYTLSERDKRKKLDGTSGISEQDSPGIQELPS